MKYLLAVLLACACLMALVIFVHAEDWYLIAPISADGHSHPFVVYNEEPYADEDECSEDLASDEFTAAFNGWKALELKEHKGDVTFGKPTCVPDPASVKADKS